MFEFHGWMRVEVNDSDDVDPPVLREREAAAQKVVQQLIADYTDDFSLMELRQSGNGLMTLIAHGLRNHRQREAITLFESVAKALPDSYGLLYYHDDEHPSESNAFRVLRFVRGRATIHDDFLLSPVIPTIEDDETGTC
jgi:Immunity protein 7